MADQGVKPGSLADGHGKKRASDVSFLRTSVERPTGRMLPRARVGTNAWSRALSPSRHHTTQAHPAFEPETHGVGRGWQLVVVGLCFVTVASFTLRPVCRPDRPGDPESGFGIRHEQRGTKWFHCEP